MHNFSEDALRPLLQQFRRSVHRSFPNDAGLADEIEEQLLKTGKGDLAEETEKKLARWCRTNGSPYQDAMPVAQRISLLLYGEVIDRDVLHT